MYDEIAEITPVFISGAVFSIDSFLLKLHIKLNKSIVKYRQSILDLEHYVGSHISLRLVLN